MRARKWMLIAVLVVLGAWWWASDRARQQTDVASAHTEASHIETSAPIDEAIATASERNEVTPATLAIAESVEDGDSIRGVVTLPDGTPPTVELTVIAWPDDGGQNVCDMAASVLHGDRSVPQARTSSSGTFVIAHMRRGATYSLTAGALGFMARDYPAHATAGGGEVTIVVEPVYAAVVKFVDAQTRGPVRVSQQLIPVGQVRSAPIEPDRNVKFAILGGANSVLAGLPSELLAYGQELRRHVQICANDSAPMHVGPLQLQVALPGYEPAQLEYFAEPLARGLHEVELALAPIASERGELALRWNGVPDGLRMSVRPILPRSTVRLESSSGHVLDYVVYDFSDPEFVLDEIPFGDYVVSVVLQSGVQGHQPIEPGRSVRIDSVRAVIDVDIGSFGALAIDVYRSDGTVFVGGLGISLGYASSDRSSSILFRAAPYVVLGLGPERWRASLMKPMVLGSDQVAEVKAGELATLKFVLP